MSDNYINQITLNCLLNKEQYERQIKNKLSKSVNKVDKKFYRKRILNLCKNMLYNINILEVTPDVKYAFDNYIKTSIEYFKVIDKSDIIQEDFKDFSNNIIIPNLDDIIDEDNELTKEETDKLLMRSIKINTNSLDNFVKKKVLKKENKKILPQQKEINLKDPNLKTKGILNNSIKKKKNITNIYEEKHTKINEEKEEQENKENNE